jgi:hypothetical protein
MGEPDDLVLHLVEREGVTVVDVGEKLFVRFLMAGGFGEVQAHESDKGVDVLDGHGLHVAELRVRGIDRDDVVKSRSHGVIFETETRLEATSKELVRNRCTSDGYIRKISVHTDVPLSGESTLIFANTLWRGAKDSVCFLRNLQSQCSSTVCEALL